MGMEKEMLVYILDVRPNLQKWMTLPRKKKEKYSTITREG